MNDAATSIEMPVAATSGVTVRPVLLSGGSGTRLWPLSRRRYPKQLLALLSEKSLLQATALRADAMDDAAAPVVICHEEHRFLVARQLQEIGVEPHRIVLEPEGRNTAAALVIAALLQAEEDPRAVLLAQPCDHHVADEAAFRTAVRRALAAARQGRLVTFGMMPSRPETGYGYIAGGASLPDGGGVLAVSRFIEKPDAATAAELLQSGDYYWNSGMFVLPVATFLDEARRLQPGLVEACERAIGDGRSDLDFFRLGEAAFRTAPSISVDKAVMEPSDRIAVLPTEIGWRDIGSWSSLHEALRELGPADDDGNVLQGDVEIDGVRNCHIDAGDRLVAAVGIEDQTVVVTDDAVLVARSDEAPRVGELVERLRRRNRQEVLEHPTVYRPWGSYRTVDQGERYQVKRIVVNPGAQLSLQMHHHRAEHWIVVHGTARIHCDGEESFLHENQSTYIPPATTHRLANPGVLPLHLIEVQSGSYLGEDDIIRFEDSYGRA